MQFALGALTVACIALIIALAIVMGKFNKGIAEVISWNTRTETHMVQRLAYVENTLGSLGKKVDGLPAPVQNIIHLDFKTPRVEAAKLLQDVPFKIEDFQVNPELLYQKMLRHLQETGDNQSYVDMPDTRAYVILDHSGMGAFVDAATEKKIRAPLARLLTNGDEEAVKSFLLLTAQSVCNGPTAATPVVN